VKKHIVILIIINLPISDLELTFN